MTEHKLPVRQLTILAICRFAEPIALTSVFPYVPEMMESFGVQENDIARWAGITSAVFSICQAFTGLLWGAASDKYGRKPIILLGLFNTMWTMLLWGFSTNLPMALVARALEGLGNGNIGILRTTVAEMCPWKDLQPRAFSVMPLVYTVGAVIGPTLGGGLSNPLRIDPRQPRGDRFLERFPYILPNVVAAAFFSIGIVVGWLFLQETLETKKGYQDLGLRTGVKLTKFFRTTVRTVKGEASVQDEHEPLLGQQKATIGEAEQGQRVAPETVKHSKPRIRDVLTHQTILNLLVYALLAFYTLAYDQLLPVFMHHAPQLQDDPNIKLPLKFAGGFGIDSQRIGIIFTFFAVSSTMWQFLLFPPIARRFGVLRCLRVALLIFPVVYFVTPFVSIIPDPTIKQIAMVVLLMIRGIGGTFSFPTSTIMLTNSASSLRVLGTVNGVATSISAVSRAAGPTVAGWLFSWGVKRGYIIVPFWFLSVVAFLAWIPTLWLVEGEGFGNDVETDEEGDTAIAQDEERGTGIDSRDASDEAMLSESEFGEPENLLSHTSTRSSLALMSDDEAEYDEAEHHPRRRSSNALSSARIHSQGRRRHVVKRQSSVPIGMGAGFRRYSSNLGINGISASGTSWGGT
ncbi:major facilitator superfamily domain-containing protein [Ampelomyces quisqualis]|uniref:Major facilitator superfamily domain-containing protein n=1 Tax=Ampelomyces quisqualis TaxID=50730 RepID=A0A6A5QPF0_AMPQU|nr:major facilitator superfamily domain-containing protein [Ampelomyces quisqualis]